MPDMGIRSYSKFSLMTGGAVRRVKHVVLGDGMSARPFHGPRGIPDDASYSTWSLHDIEGSDAHSASWLVLDEILHHPQYKVPIGEYSSLSFGEWFLGDRGVITDLDCLRDEEHLRNWPDRIRFVFWFDN